MNSFTPYTSYFILEINLCFVLKIKNMPRSVNSVASRNRRRKVLKAAKGYFGARSKVLTVAKNAVDKAMLYAYVGRKLKKRAYRRLWIARINAGVRPLGMSYSVFINKLNKAEINLNRKVLADLALNNYDAFKAIVEKVNSVKN